MKRTPLRALGTRLARLLDAIDHILFREPDLDAISRNWDIGQTRFRRTYRDPRWNRISRCTACAGAGRLGGRCCSDCRGGGTIRHDLVTDRCTP